MADFPKKTPADWEKLAAKELRDKPLSSLDWMTPEGIPVKPLYTAADLENLESVGSMPGFPPFTRGPKATDRKSTRLNSSHLGISYAVFCLKKKKNTKRTD